MNKWTSKLLKQASLKVVMVVILFLVSLYVFAWIADEAVLEKEDLFDSSVHTFVVHHSTDAFVSIMQKFTFLGSSSFLFPAYVLIVLFFLLAKKYRVAIDIAVVALSSFFIMFLLKHIFQRQRPDLPIIKGITTYSFPSGHTLSSFVFCSLLAYIVWNTHWHIAIKWLLTFVLFLLSLTVGISRIVLNVHFATDVIASFCLGVMWVIVSFWLLSKINRVPTQV